MLFTCTITTYTIFTTHRQAMINRRVRFYYIFCKIFIRHATLMLSNEAPFKSSIQCNWFSLFCKNTLWHDRKKKRLRIIDSAMSLVVCEVTINLRSVKRVVWQLHILILYDYDYWAKAWKKNSMTKWGLEYTMKWYLKCENTNIII